MDFLPIYFDIRGKHCLVVGGSEVAARKASLLLNAGAQVTVVAPELAPAFKDLPHQEQLRHRVGTFDPSLLDGVELVMCALEDEAAARVVADAARARHLPVNVVDTPHLCSFVMPSIIDRSPILIAVGSGGASPVLARMLRARLESMIPAAYGRLSALAAQFRDKVKAKFQRAENRRMFWEKVFEGPVAEMVFAGQDQAAAATLDAIIAGEIEPDSRIGEVYLVGGGPGNPDLLTFRALRLMQQADVVVYDNLVSPAVLDMCRRDADRIYVGKKRADHALPQEGINDLLVRLAKEGKRVCRLKGGDPFIFGRGGEEIETLAQHKIPFQVVPGITAAAGVASYTGIPLTHRDHAQACIFVTGHLKDGSMNLDWDMLARPHQTIVIYMGLHGLPVLCGKLIEHGLAKDTPAAIVQQGTTSKQRVVTGTLATLPGIAEAAKLHAPTLIIVGSVVTLHDKLKWFNPKESKDGLDAR
jgi:uroporphyrin-III C-methyltransferase/precorrin-2 dehydrogenase/sirohydrochlorin ferrochelatase